MLLLHGGDPAESSLLSIRPDRPHSYSDTEYGESKSPTPSAPVRAGSIREESDWMRRPARDGRSGFLHVRSEQQVPHRAWRPVRNDIVIFSGPTQAGGLEALPGLLNPPFRAARIVHACCSDTEYGESRSPPLPLRSGQALSATDADGMGHPVVIGGRISCMCRVNSRFLTGLGARFGMTSLFFRARLRRVA
jgi:hypothetical protein